MSGRLLLLKSNFGLTLHNKLLVIVCHIDACHLWQIAGQELFQSEDFLGWLRVDNEKGKRENRNRSDGRLYCL